MNTITEVIWTFYWVIDWIATIWTVQYSEAPLNNLWSSIKLYMGEEYRNEKKNQQRSVCVLKVAISITNSINRAFVWREARRKRKTKKKRVLYLMLRVRSCKGKRFTRSQIVSDSARSAFFCVFAQKNGIIFWTVFDLANILIFEFLFLFLF